MKGAVQVNAYEYSSWEKLRLFLPCLKQRLRPKQNLFAGPFAGEFGYELMQWQGFVRARRRYYEQVHVLTYPGREYLYEGCHVHSHNIDLKRAGYWYGRLSPAQMHHLAHAQAKVIGLRDYDIFDTSLLCTRYHKMLFWWQEFRLFCEPPLNKRFDLVFHFRAVRKEGPDNDKNYPTHLADELSKHCFNEGLSVACVGHPDYSYCPPHCDDYRSVDLKQTVKVICSAHAGAGEASGGMHLVNICGKPSIIWGEGQWRIDPALRWNPFQVPIYVLSNTTWQPTPDDAFKGIADALKDLGEKTNAFALPAYTLPAMSIAAY